MDPSMGELMDPSMGQTTKTVHPALAVVRWPERAALFDGAGGADWLAFTEPLAVLEAKTVEAVPALLDRVESETAAGRWAVGFVAYEAAGAFDPAFPTLAPSPTRPAPPHGSAQAGPLAWFSLFDRPRPLQLPAPPEVAGAAADWQPELTRADYLDRVRRIRAWIARGDTYQTNLTYRLRCLLEGDPWTLFTGLCTTQPVDYACYLETDSWAVCSASPELFFELEERKISCRPMKGTRPRGRTVAEDAEARRALESSPKDRAENLMIVDMVRNDLGRICDPASVAVRGLFGIERYATVWQMTSEVHGTTGVGLAEIFAALFPSASITGAPKVRTMQIIGELETSPRGVYTGAVGVVAPGRHSRFSVAIRTAFVDRTSGQAEYGVGGGIVWDSSAADEHAESRAKAVALARPRPSFSLLETLLWDPPEGLFLLDRHLERLAASAGYFGFPFDSEEARRRLQGEKQATWSRRRRFRLLLSPAGLLTVESEALAEIPEPWRVVAATHPIDPSDPFLFHKTTHRRAYDERRSASPEADDVLLWNPDGELTESTRANLAVRRGGVWVTPPVECGLLAGTFRAGLLERGELREERILLSELESAEEIRLINSVRGWIRVELR
jgi:para-aminobenzoate synthetase/4-amino-4-deoxychorismate lyase